VNHLKAHQALGYGVLPSFGLLIKPPVLYYLFDDESSARECFTIFKRWVDHSNDGDAVSLTFIEFDDGAYALVTAPDLDRLIDRTLPSSIQEEFETLAITATKMLEVPKQSDHYRWFKAAVTTSPFVVAPAAVKSGPLLTLAFRKREISFWRASEVPEGHPAYRYAQRRGRAEKEFKRHGPPVPPSAEVFLQRERQLKRFFPVTLERLRFNRGFVDIQRSLERRGFQLWQIRQAACNLTLKHRRPELYSDGEGENGSGPAAIVMHLLYHEETIDEEALPAVELNPEALRTQIIADGLVLLQHLEPKTQGNLSQKAIQGRLQRMGLRKHDNRSGPLTEQPQSQ
jgi:hypothetical protein